MNKFAVSVQILKATVSAAVLMLSQQSVAQDSAIERGEYLSHAGNCMTCHTREGGEPFAGGVAFETDFGTIYSTNITPDTTAGIGDWSEEDFVRAMHEGVSADGSNLYPAFPYPSFTKVSESDVKAIFAYMKTVAPSSYQPPENDMGFPFNQRGLMSIWNALFFEEGRFEENSSEDAEWNRGAYLVEGLTHCGTCHTPRNALGGLDAARALSGGTYNDKVAPGEIRPWSAVNLTQATDGLASWSQEDIFNYLHTGHGARAGTFGPMNEVITESLQKLSAEDVTAMSVYIKSLPPIERAPELTLSADELRAGELLYTVHCGTCHLPSGEGDPSIGPPVAGSAIVQAEDPASLINVILYGAEVPFPAPPGAWKSMEAFGQKLDDDEVAELSNYLRASWGNRGGRVTEDDVIRQR